MATVRDWAEGIRVRTLPASIAPVILGAGIAGALQQFSIIRTLLAAGVALLFQIGANLANDYSDGIRGTDDHRIGPPRLTGGGKAEPRIVKRAAFISFGLACICGLVLVWLSGHWWLLIAGACAVLAAWFYTGGKHPYGYAGFGEIFVLIFFGYMATLGTVYTQTDTAPLAAWILATGIGLIACALLMVNNIRDIPSDIEAGKRTLAVRLGDKTARWIYYAMLATSVILASAMYLWNFYVMFGMLAMIVWVIYLARPVISGRTGADLLPILRGTGLFELVYAIEIAAALVLSVSYPNAPWAVIGWSITIGTWLIFLIIELVGMLRHRRHASAHAANTLAPTSAVSSEPTQPTATSETLNDSDASEKHAVDHESMSLSAPEMHSEQPEHAETRADGDNTGEDRSKERETDGDFSTDAELAKTDTSREPTQLSEPTEQAKRAAELSICEKDDEPHNLAASEHQDPENKHGRHLG